MGDEAVADVLDIYNRRTDLLCLVCAGTLDKRELERQIACSRPTIDRSFRELEDLGVLASSGTTHELTAFGELFCQEFTRTRAALTTLTDMRDVLSVLPRDSPIDMRLLKGATAHRAAEHAPQEPFLDVVDAAADATEIRGYSSTVLPSYVDAFYSLVVEEAMPATLVFTADVVETLERNYPDRFADLTEADHTTVYETTATEMYGLLVGDDVVAVPVGDDGGSLRGVVVNDTPAALTWAEAWFEELVSANDTSPI
ncbi:helix-turn-helix transcriptional regulator [Halosimplex amylolyticum]|uniref:helix-turn-helix transcriptional regulator n=1 Tax=Halosimplex amylolyticum TaxID=3396616 RepID=UPI003F568C46